MLSIPPVALLRSDNGNWYDPRMETFGQRLRRLREAANFGLNEFAALVEKDPGGISRIERGERWAGKAPPGDDVAAFARALGVSTDYLLGRTDEPQGEDRRPAFLRSPLAALLKRLGAEQSGEEYEFDMTASAGTGGKQPKSNRIKVRKPHYLIEVEGDCMVPEIESGDTVRFDPTLDPENGDWVVATVDGERAIVKKLVVEGGIAQRLLPLNGEPLVIDENVRIVGVVISYERPGPRGRRKRSA